MNGILIDCARYNFLRETNVRFFWGIWGTKKDTAGTSFFLREIPRCHRSLIYGLLLSKLFLFPWKEGNLCESVFFFFGNSFCPVLRQMGDDFRQVVAAKEAKIGDYFATLPFPKKYVIFQKYFPPIFSCGFPSRMSHVRNACASVPLYFPLLSSQCPDVLSCHLIWGDIPTKWQQKGNRRDQKPHKKCAIHFPHPKRGKNIRNGPFFIQLKWNFHALLFLRDVPIKKRTFYVRENDTCKGCFRKNMRNSNQLGDIFWNILEGHMSSFYLRAI